MWKVCCTKDFRLERGGKSLVVYDVVCKVHCMFGRSVVRLEDQLMAGRSMHLSEL